MRRRFPVFRLIIWTIAAALLFFVSIVFLNIAFGPGAAFAQWELVFGWIGFIRRVASQVEFHWLPMLFYSVGVMIVLEGAHRFFAWIYACRHHPDTSNPDSTELQWHRRWTLGICGLVLTITFIAMAGLGIIHQAGWMITADAPVMIKTSSRPYMLAKMVDLEIRLADSDGINAQSNPEELRQILTKQDWWQTESEGFRVFILKSDGDLPGVLVFRDQAMYEPAHRGFGVVFDGDDFSGFGIAELSQMVSRYSDRMYPIQ